MKKQSIEVLKLISTTAILMQRAYQSALEAIDNSSEKAKLLTDSPNNLTLGIRYIKALKQLNSKMDVIAISRIKHNENMQEVLSGQPNKRIES